MREGVDQQVHYAGHEVIYNSVILTDDQTAIDIRVSYREKIRRFLLVFQPEAKGESGIWVHTFPYGISIAFNRWGTAEESVINPPVRLVDFDGQRFELYIAHKRLQRTNRAVIQITAIQSNYGGPYVRPLYGSDQPPALRV